MQKQDLSKETKLATFSEDAVILAVQKNEIEANKNALNSITAWKTRWNNQNR